ncbi:MAG: dipeptide ABC transporter ATP-binding protein [Acetobacteraceae bacterium]
MLAGGGMIASEPLLEVRDLRKHYVMRAGPFGRATLPVRAVDGISFTLSRGETLGLVGESGCGKSTAGKALMRLIEPSSGSVRLNGVELSRLSKREMHAQRRQMQAVFQDPYSSLNPKLTAGALVAEPLINFGLGDAAARRARVEDLFGRVGLRAADMAKYPHEFSGGQRQRLGIARALAPGPALVVGDEPVSALDVSVQAQVVNLLVRLQQEFGLAYLFIAHDLAVVRHISDRVAVMYLGRIVELAPTEALFARPAHPYTQALLDAIPVPDPRRHRRRVVLRGEVPSPVRPPPGCHFHPRCPIATGRCRVEDPALRDLGDGHSAACHYAPAPRAEPMETAA